MSERNQTNYKKELKMYAELYSAILRLSSKEGYLRSNQIMDKTLKGNWLSMHTTARTVELDREDGTKLRVLVVTKKGHKNTGCAGFLWLHGGGYAMGLPEMEVPYADLLTEDDSCVMVLPDYRRSVEEPYPAALEDAYQTLLWMRDNAESLGIREDQLFIGGESAGGGLACAVTLYARDKQEVNIAFQMPLYPMLDDRMTETSSHNNAPVWDTKKNLTAWKLYRGERRITSEYFAPAREAVFINLPPAFTIITDTEPFYAETKTYFKHLYEAGVEIMCKEYMGCFHAFDICCPFTESAKHAKKLELNAFRYAKDHFYTAQPKDISEVEPFPFILKADDQEDTEIEGMIEDIETQHEILDSAKEDKTEEIPAAAETAPEEVNVPEENLAEEPVSEESPAENPEEKVPNIESAETETPEEEPAEDISEEGPFPETEAEEEAKTSEVENPEAPAVEENPAEAAVGIPSIPFPENAAVEVSQTEAVEESEKEKVPSEEMSEEVPQTETAEEPVKEESPAEEVPPTELFPENETEEVPETEAAEETVKEEAPAEEMPAETSEEETPVETAEEVPSEPFPENEAEEVPPTEPFPENKTEEVPETAATAEPVKEETPAEETPVETAEEEIPVETAAEEIHSEEVSTEPFPENETEEVPETAATEEPVKEETPAEETPVETAEEEIPVETAAEEIHSEEVPTEPFPENETEEAPQTEAAEESVKEETPAEETPVETAEKETPAEGVEDNPFGGIEEAFAQEHPEDTEDEEIPDIESLGQAPAESAEEVQETVPEGVPLKTEEITEVEERPVSASTTVVFPTQTDEDPEIISEKEIEEISRKLSDIPTVVPISFEEALEQHEEEIKDIPMNSGTVSEETKEEIETKGSEEAEPEEPEEEIENKVGSFTRDDVIKILQKKESVQKTGPKSEEEEKADLMSHVQEIIDDDITASLQTIDDLVDRL